MKQSTTYRIFGRPIGRLLLGLLVVGLVSMMTPAFAGIIVTVGKTGPTATSGDGTHVERRGGLEPDDDMTEADPVPSRPSDFDNTPFDAEEYATDEEAAPMDCQPVGGGIMWCKHEARDTGASAGAAGAGGLSDDTMDVDGSGDLEALGCTGGGGQAPAVLLLAVLAVFGLRRRQGQTH
ncbi:MAG: MYXO-CTERM domain-containing protein [Myxococcota bacterium]|jgi:MYXO-CTERM domain-containing protein